MPASSSVHSNALNFMSCLKSGVDPRTGLYNISVNLPEILGNDLRGPGFGIGLSYSPLTLQDSGYGMGWSLQQSQYNPTTQILSLSTGETFKVTSSEDNRLLMKEQKLDSFHFYQQDATQYRVMHKSGLVEILELKGNETDRVALPVRIYSATGHGINLAYKAFSSTRPILQSITDDQDQTLLTLQRLPQNSMIEIELYPGAGPEGSALARFVMMLGGSDNRVTRIILPTENEACWRFVYEFKQTNQLCITEVQTPTGAVEQIYYQDLGHQFPDSVNRDPLPRVTRHLIRPGAKQPDVDVRYTYLDSQLRPRNFLGHGLSSLPWADDGLDNLYRQVGEYDYVCTETLWKDERPVRSIARTFNRFHLQTLETTQQNNNVQTVKTTYNIKAGVLYELQPYDCQMPIEIKSSWGLLDNATRYRTETVINTYDSHGNLRVHQRADGIIETSTWYPADSALADGCPPDPEGFVRHLKDKTISPATSAQGNAPTLTTRYRYNTLPALSASLLDDWTAPESETLVQLDPHGDLALEQELQCTRIQHLNQPDDPFLHARIERQTQTLNAKSTITDYAYEKLDSAELGLPVQQSRQTLSTDFDSVSKTILRQHSLLTGQELMSQAEGVQTRYVYDALNRLIRETIAPDSKFEACREYQYILCANAGEQAQQVLISARNVTTRTQLDGLGRAVYEERNHVDESQPEFFRQTWGAQYSALNTLEKETQYDLLQDQALNLDRNFSYDDWGQQCCVTGADGVESHQDLDPIGNRQFSGTIQRNWVQSAGTSPRIIRRSETWLNLFGKADKIISLDAAQQEISARTYLYDGLGRCTQQTDELQHHTFFHYDAWSRLIKSTLPDESVITRDYELFSSAEMPTVLKVMSSADARLGSTGAHLDSNGSKSTLFDPAEAGRQTFDGLGRLTEIKVGKRTETYTYDADQMQVKSKTTAAGIPITFDYNPLLTDQPISSSAPDEKAAFEYDTISARLIRASNERGSRTYDYDAQNRLRSESWSDNQGVTWKTLHESSIQGRQIKRTELIQGTVSGLETGYAYDTFGRLNAIDQGNLQVSLGYNELSQTTLVTTRDVSAGTALVIALEYDDQGRETRRTLTFDQQPSRTLEQVWQLDGLLLSRHLQTGNLSLLMETFKYDARGRLSLHTCSGSTLPRDALSREIASQIFNFDVRDNISLSMTTFVDGTHERARFSYTNVEEPCQLTGITYTPARATPAPVFSYDLNGNQLNDEHDQRLNYDNQNRLLRVESPDGQPISQYAYDSHDHLLTSRHGSDSETLHFYQEQQLSSSVQDDRQNQYLYLGSQPLGQQQPDDATQTLLLLSDANNSVLGESQQSELRTAVYSAYGERHSDEQLLGTLGFNGEARETSNGWYLLGKGYRAYNPGLMRFHSPDSLSPFGAGGVNPYAYCLGNPIALRDPTGHDASGHSGRLRRPDENAVLDISGGGGGNFMAWVFVAIGVAATAWGAYATVASFGLAAPVSVPVTVMGISTTAATASAVATGALAIGTAASAVSTGASAYAAATGDETAEQIGMYVGIAAIPIDVVGGFAKSAVKTAMKQANKMLMSADQMLLNGVANSAAPTTIPRARLSPHTSGNLTADAVAQHRSVPEAVAASVSSSATAGTRTGITAEALAAGATRLKPNSVSANNVATVVADDEFRLALAARLANSSASEAVAASRRGGPSAQLQGILTHTRDQPVLTQNIRR